MKTCSQCRLNKPEAEFHKSKLVKSGRMAHCKACHRDMAKRTPSGRDPIYHREAMRRRRKEDPCRALWLQARGRARREGIPFTIEPAHVPIPPFCPLLGLPIVVGTGAGLRDDRSPPIDRIDSSRGYVPGNVWVVSWRANKIKNEATIEELEQIARGLRACKVRY